MLKAQRKYLITTILLLTISVILLVIMGGNKVEAALSDLFISEYIEGSSNNKAIELYNGTGETIDLGAEGYNIKMFFNGSSTAGLTINLSGTVADGDVFVLVHSSAAAGLLSLADQTNNLGWYNGDDAVVLYKGAIVVDSIGRIGEDPGDEWSNSGVTTGDSTLVRNSSITSGDTDPYNAFDPAAQWIAYPVNTYSYVGSHVVDSYDVTFDLGEHGTLGSGDLIQSVYIGDSAIAPTVIPDQGYDFIGWDVTFDNITEDLTVTAQYEIQTYSVDFQVGEGLFINTGGGQNQLVDYLDLVTEPADPERSAYNFQGWYIDESFSALFDFSTGITEDLILYAKWEPIIIINLPEIQNLTVGDKLNLAPEPKGGEWTYDPEFLKLNEDGSFTALKAGNTIVEYTYNGVNSRVEIVIKDQVIVAIIESLPKTGGFIPLLTATSLVLGGSMIINKSRKK